MVDAIRAILGLGPLYATELGTIESSRRFRTWDLPTEVDGNRHVGYQRFRFRV